MLSSSEERTHTKVVFDVSLFLDIQHTTTETAIEFVGEKGRSLLRVKCSRAIKPKEIWNPMVYIEHQ